MNLWAKQKQSGFTIVELLIVIVVIAILAAISIVAYSGIQERANITSTKSSLAQINKAIQAYRVVNGEYPGPGAWSSQNDANKDTFITGLVPNFISSLPRAIVWGGTPTFYYRSSNSGADYKFLYLYPTGQVLPTAMANDSQVQAMLDPVRSDRAWGYWSAGASST